jgi:hypothetical protein
VRSPKRRTRWAAASTPYRKLPRAFNCAPLWSRWGGFAAQMQIY